MEWDWYWFVVGEFCECVVGDEVGVGDDDFVVFVYVCFDGDVECFVFVCCCDDVVGVEVDVLVVVVFFGDGFV